MAARWHANVWVVASLIAIVFLCGSFAFFLGPTWKRDPLSEAVSAYERGDWTVAHAVARGQLENSKSNPAALRLMARSAARLGRDESAEALYRRLGAEHMEAEDLFLLGRGLLKNGRTGPALSALRASRDADPNHAETLEALAQYYSRIGLTENARELAERLSRQSGWEVRGRTILAPLQYELRDPSATAAALGEALAIDPQLKGASMSQAEAAKLLATSLLECGRPQEASQALAGLGQNGKDVEVAWLKSRILLQQGHTDEAKAALQGAGDLKAADPMRKEPATYVGASECASCHDQQFEAQQHSRHSETFMNTAALNSIPLPDHPVPDPVDTEVQHTFHRSGNKVEVLTRTEGGEFRALLEYALGSNHQGRSFLARESDGQMRELRISQYPDPPLWDRTNQHPERPPDAHGYLGRPLPAATETACLECHVTSPSAVRNPTARPEAKDRGIGCERCHGPGGNHLLAIQAQFPELAIARPKLAKAERIMALCGDCHKAPPGSPPNDPGFIRFQAPTLIMSRCYIESVGGMSCVTCHDPHRNVEKSATHYESICLSCHASTKAKEKVINSPERAATCPVNPTTKCLECHMPRLTDAVPRATFTDHFIRVRRDLKETGAKAK